MITLVASCRKHPRYQAKLPPRCDCVGCAKLYALAREYDSTARTPTSGSLPSGPRAFCSGLVIPAMLVGTRSMEVK